MKCNAAGLAIIKKYEGFSSWPYACPAGVPTIGYGSTRYVDGTKVKLMDTEISPAQAEALLKYSLGQIEQELTNLFKSCKITENQFSAVCSFTYNLGIGNLKKSTLLKKIFEGDHKGAAAEFPKWNKAGGYVLVGLIKRRLDESLLYTKNE